MKSAPMVALLVIPNCNFFLVTLRQFELMRSVGRGAFGKVRIVRHKRTEKLYAMKYINKEKCIAQSAVKNTLLERNLLEAIEHPLIVNLR